jgi:ABC-type transport system substrate-binding protein
MQPPRVTRLVMGVVGPGPESNSMRTLGQGETWQIRPIYEHLIGLDRESGGQLTAALRAFRFDNHFGIRASSGELFVTLAAHNSSVLGNYLGEQSPDLNALVRRIQVELDVRKRDDLYRQAGNIAYDLHLGIPLFWLPAEALINPNVIADYGWPGSISGTWTHVEYIKAAR